MKRTNRMAALALGGLLALSLTACGGEAPAGGVEGALEKLRAAESMEAEMTLEMDFSLLGQSIETTTFSDVSSFSDPTKLKADVTVGLDGLGSMTMLMYAAMEGDTCTAYVYDGSGWTAQTAELSDLQQYNMQECLDLYLGSGDSYTLVGTEEIGGSPADKYTGVVRGERLDEVLAASGAAENLEASAGELDLAGMYGELGDLEIAVWVDQESGYPARCSIDMTAIMQAALEKSLAADSEAAELYGTMTMDKISMVIDCSNFNQAADFDIPAEALAAAGAE